MKKLFVFIILAFYSQVFAGVISKHFLVQFTTDSYTFDDVAFKQLAEVMAYLKENPTARIKLTGRTDYDGTIGYNIALSRNRTGAVSIYLKERGWQKTEINESWVGELKPLADNNDENGKALNRSVEIFITVINYDNVTEWFNEKQQGYTENFTLKKSGKNIIKTENETEITIPAKAFVDNNGKSIDNKDVKIVIKEVNSTFDAIINQVYTMCGDKLLETGGMLNIEAYANNEKLNLAEGNEIIIKIPSKKTMNDMLVFEGVTNKTGKIDWKNTGALFASNAQLKKVSIKLNESVLKELINGIENKKTTFEEIQLIYTLPKITDIPSKPKMPIKPEKPEARKLFSAIGWYFATPKIKQKLVKKVQTKNIENYEKNLANYNRRLRNYEKAICNRKGEVEKYEAEIDSFYTWIKETKAKVYIAMNNIYDEHDRERAKRGLQKLYASSVNGTQYCTKPLSFLRNFARTTRLTEDETLKLEYLNGIKISLNHLEGMEYDAIVKKYGRSGKIRIMKTAYKNSLGLIYGNDRLWCNKFLDDFIMENKESFSLVFEEEMNEQLSYVAMQQNITQKNISRDFFTGNSKKLGWINCDRFVNSPMITVNFKKYPGTYQAVILSSFKSVLNPSYYSETDEITTANIPKNEKFKLLTIKIEKDMAFISIVESTATEGLILEPELKKVPVEDVDVLLSKL